MKRGRQGGSRGQGANGMTVAIGQYRDGLQGIDLNLGAHICPVPPLARFKPDVLVIKILGVVQNSLGICCGCTFCYQLLKWPFLLRHQLQVVCAICDGSLLRRQYAELIV